MAGANIKYGSKKNLWALARKILSRKRFGSDKKGFGDDLMICYKAGAPASNTAADDPGRAGVFIVDTSGPGLHFCSAYTDSSNFTIVDLA